MKSVATRKKLPATSADWDAVIAAAPGRDRPPTPTEKNALDSAVVVKGGGYAAVVERPSSGTQQARCRPMTDAQPAADAANAAHATERAQQRAAFEKSCLASTAKLDGWRFDRDQANAR